MKTVAALVLAITLLMPGAAYAGAPTDSVKKHVDKFLEILQDPELSDNKKKQEEELWDVALKLFDFTALSMRSVGTAWREMTNEQKKEFTDLFAKLLERTYMDKIREYNDEKVVYEDEVMLSDSKAEVQSKIVTQGKEIPILYRLYKTSGEWRVYDVLIENVSMVKNYRTQFRDYLSKNSVEDLLEHLRKKTAEE
jgi:phospholipid transport system substrate-binding protein